jgi:putative transposase
MAFRAPDFSKPVLKHTNHLPHWEQDGVTCFITFRLADSIPGEELDQWMSERNTWLEVHGLAHAWEVDWLPDHQRQEFHERFTARFHAWLDSGEGECLLQQEECADSVASALRHFDGERYELESFVVMPNHVHVLVTPRKGEKLSGITHSWKSYTAHKINKHLGRQGTLWQKESYDHLVRHQEQFHHYRRYIHANPSKARLSEAEFVWWDASGVP